MKSKRRTESELGRHRRNEVPIFAPGIGTRINAAAKMIGSRAQAAAAAGVSEDMLYRYIREESQPSFSSIVGLGRAACLSLEWFATGVDDRSTDRVSENPAEYIRSDRVLGGFSHAIERARMEMFPELFLASMTAVENITKGSDLTADKKAELILGTYAAAYAIAGSERAIQSITADDLIPIAALRFRSSQTK